MSDIDTDRTTAHLTANGTTATERAAASRAVLRAARDRDDLRHLLAILGLDNRREGQ